MDPVTLICLVLVAVLFFLLIANVVDARRGLILFVGIVLVYLIFTLLR